MTDATLVLVTLAIVSGVRKLVPRVDGPYLVLACAAVVGVATAAAQALLSGAGLSMAVLATGGTSAALAFGFASLGQWFSALLPALNIDARTVSRRAMAKPSNPVVTTDRSPGA